MSDYSKTNNGITQRAELHRKIWSIADNVRGAVDGWDFKQYILGILFYRFISENITDFFNFAEWEAGKYENSLHFQRRLLSQYYYQLAALRYEGCRLTRLAKEKVREDFTAREAKLLSLLSYMNKAAETIFTEYDITGMPYADDKQNILLQKLYDEAQQW